MIKFIIQKLVLLRNLLIYKRWNFTSKLSSKSFRKDGRATFIVSIASYPKRAHLLPAVFEALNTQTVVPRKWILVLSEEEWPNLHLPKHLKKLEFRGVEILWVKNNTYAVKKLVPVIQKFPDLAIVTLDDDIIYSKILLKGLIEKSLEEKNVVIGYVGKSLLKKNKVLDMYNRENGFAKLSTPSEQVYLIGWGGIFYPAFSLHKKVLNASKISKIVPGRGSDIWFWAAAVANDTKQMCLGIPKSYNLGVPIPQNRQTQPKDQPKTDVLLERFQMAIDYFEIRDKLLETLPNQN